jgi:hypothetical protein
MGARPRCNSMTKEEVWHDVWNYESARRRRGGSGVDLFLSRLARGRWVSGQWWLARLSRRWRNGVGGLTCSFLVGLWLGCMAPMHRRNQGLCPAGTGLGWRCADGSSELRPDLCFLGKLVVRVSRPHQGSLCFPIRRLFRCQTHLPGTRAPIVRVFDELTKPLHCRLRCFEQQIV